MKTALIIGSTGLVGEQCLKVLLASNYYSKVIALTRRRLDSKNVKLENLVVDFDKLVTYREQIKADDIYCAIGTTIGKAGSQAAFRKVDFEIPLQVAEIAKQNGAEKFILVSSLSANAKSMVFYSRTKGQLEEALAKLNYGSLIIFRPSLLLGDRKEKRTGEQVAEFLMKKLPFLVSGPFAKYKGTPADLLAATMVKLGTSNVKGVRAIDNDEIFVLAEK